MSVKQTSLGYSINEKTHPNMYTPRQDFDPVENIKQSNLSKVFDRIANDIGVSTKNPRLFSAFKKDIFETFQRDFGSADQSDVTDKSMEFIKKYKSQYAGMFNDFVRQGYVTSQYDPNVDQTSQKLFLRARDGFATATKTPVQEAKDTVIANLFNVKTNEEGENNDIYLDNLRNQHLRFENSNKWPVDNVPNTLGFEEQPVSRIPEKELEINGPSISLTQGNNYQPIPYTGQMRFSTFVPADQQPGPMTYDTANAFGGAGAFNNYLGFKNIYDSMRQPLQPSNK